MLLIGRRPIFAFGNSDGDLAMLRYTLAGKGPRMAWYVHHDDAGREFADDRDFKLSALRERLDRPVNRHRSGLHEERLRVIAQ
jgi:hypothetical protein